MMYYTGPSMAPTLKAGDLLEAAPYGRMPVARGDVIVFRPRGEAGLVTHRVIAVNAGMFTARGDNNSRTDPWAISDSDIIGRVTHAERRGRRRRINGGTAGLAYSYLLRAANHADALICLLLRRVYRGLAESAAVRRLSPPVEVRVVSLNRPGGAELKLLMGRHIIGRLMPGCGRWQIKRPFRLLVDEAALPCPYREA